MRDDQLHDTGGIEALERRELLAGDLSVSLGTLTNPFDKGKKTDMVRVVATVSNVGTVAYRGQGNVLFFLSTDNTFDAADVQFASVKLPKLSSAGSRGTVKLDVPEPKFVNPANPANALAAGAYFVIAKLDLGTAGFDTNTANDTAAAVQQVAVDYTFGRIQNVNVALTVPLPDGTTATFGLQSDGLGTLTRDSSGRTVVTITGGGRSTALTIKGNDKKKASTIGVISSTGLVQSVKGDNVIVEGNINLSLGVSDLRIAGLRNSSVTLGAFFSSVSLDLGEVRDSVVLSTNTPVNRLIVKSWKDTNAGQDLFKAPSVGQIGSSGDFQPSVTLTSLNQESVSATKITVNGQLSGGWSFAGGAGTISAGSIAPTFRGGIIGGIENLRTTKDLSGLCAFQTIKRLEVGGSINGATFLAGTILGDDLLLGGSGTNAGGSFAGTIEFITVKGSVNNSIFAAGLRTTNDVLLDGDDTFVTDGFSGIRSLEVRGQFQNSKLVSTVIPDTVKIANRRVNTANDARFVRTLPIV